jgi:hypothetical protein
LAIRVRVADSSIKQLLHAYNGLHMLPNLKILICGVVFGPLLFAVTGAGVLLPDSNTRVGEMPEIGRPMMQRIIAEEPAHFRIMTVARRSEELERLRELSAVEVAPAQLEPDLLKPAVVENPVSDDVLVTDEAGPVLPPPGAMETVSGTASGPLQVRPTETSTDVPPDDASPMQVATLPAIPPDGDLTEHAPSVLNVPLPPLPPLPPLRPIARTSSIPKRVFHRKPRIAQPPTPSDTFGQSLFARPLLGPR